MTKQKEQTKIMELQEGLSLDLLLTITDSNKIMKIPVNENNEKEFGVRIEEVFGKLKSNYKRHQIEYTFNILRKDGFIGTYTPYNGLVLVAATRKGIELIKSVGRDYITA